MCIQGQGSPLEAQTSGVERQGLVLGGVSQVLLLLASSLQWVLVLWLYWGWFRATSSSLNMWHWSRILCWWQHFNQYKVESEQRVQENANISTSTIITIETFSTLISTTTQSRLSYLTPITQVTIRIISLFCFKWMFQLFIHHGKASWSPH